ncbi:MAG: hypothetical protein LC713_07650 [Actinobacteria bacterium]|nr:hypothetical protein [Actinomycetota bacterium]
MTAQTVATAIAAAALLGGCGLQNPDAAKPPPPAQVAVPVAPPGLRTPPAVLTAQHDPLVRIAVDYTLTQATWSPDTYVDQQAHLAELSTGQALADLTPRPGEPPAAVAARLKAAGSSSRATLIATDATAARQLVVVYKAVATGVGRSTGHPDYQIAHVTLTRSGRGWLVSGFQIQP